MGVLGASACHLAWQVGGWMWPLAWPGVAALLLSLVYFAGRPGLFGKRVDGTMRWWVVAPMFPFFAFTWAFWHYKCVMRREDPAHEVAPGLWVGRRPFIFDLPPGTRLIVDLTAEFPVHRTIRRAEPAIPVLIVPTLDGTPPPASGLARVIEEAVPVEGPVYVHCQAGHGRSATAAAAILIERGLAGDVHEAERLMQKARPRIHLTPAQRNAVTQACG